ncbi:hypothetical protein [Bradyrhizobium sp. 199]|uniref:hypothetical protein n=1 Tax=Bradyrhizobium sp. 199 TaxID=2782664 RepID=UPI001FFB97AD|nr:hypothetical protein [Bradyrhizobium sp. 199]MCK1361487.1 hypothetical protein [Bradyrhizobium sp. 199]
MEQEATYRGTVYPSQCDHVGHMNIMWHVGKFAPTCEITGVHMDRSQRKSTPFADAVRKTALRQLAEPVEV